MTLTHASPTVLRLGHSPDPDDAFMWYPLANFPDGSGPGGRTFTPKIETRGYQFVHILEDIQSLNQRCEAGELEVTALSIHQYPFVADKYALTRCGSSMGDNYGPMVVAPAGRGLTLANLPRLRLAVPGLRTTAFLALSLLARERGEKAFAHEVVPFDRIIPAVAAGVFVAGLIIHVGHLTYRQAGLECLVDLGRWWTGRHDLPLPLGGNAIRRDLGEPVMREVCTILLESIRYALEHRDEAVRYALNYARDMGQDLADRFVGMYVNKWTLDYGPVGRRAVNTMLREAAAAGLVPAVGDVDFIEPA
jgi:1,4-dihydroxy-6-naphthoate synthase